MNREDIKVILGLIDRRIRESTLRLSRGSGGIEAYLLHTHLRDMPSAVVADHDGRYYTETELGSVASSLGASLIGIEDVGGYYTSIDIEGALQELGGGGVCSGVQIITDDDPILGPRKILHFISGSGISITSVDDTAEEEIEITIIGEALYSDYIHIRDEKAAGTDGGTFTQGAWRTRDLTIELSDTGGDAVLAGNQITLEAGTYRCLISCPGYRVHRHKSRLQNITDGTTILVGTSEYGADAHEGHTRSFTVGRFTLATQKVLEVQHRCQTTQIVFGLGLGSGFGVIEVYTEVELWRET